MPEFSNLAGNRAAASVDPLLEITLTRELIRRYSVATGWRKILPCVTKFGWNCPRMRWGTNCIAISFLVLLCGRQTWMWAGVLLNLGQMPNILKTSVLYFLFMTHLTTLAVARTRGAQIPGDYVFFYGGDKYFWTPSTELPSCHPSGAQNNKVAATFMECLYSTPLAQVIKLDHPTLRWIMNSNYDGRGKQRPWPTLQYCPGIFLQLARLFVSL